MSLDDAGQAGPDPAQPAPDPFPHLRRITDAQTMRALAHPVRVALIEQLSLGGAMTATEVGERIGESPTTCSFHLRQLAKYGWVEEAGGGKGRARPWRMTSIGFQTSSTHDDPETDIAARTLSRMFRERQLDRYQTWTETKGAYPRQWQNASSDGEYMFYLTPEELERLTREVHEVIMPWFEEGRLTDPSQRPPGAVPVELLMFAYPIELPGQPTNAEPTGDQPTQEGTES
jgi:DNA-binding transcriptional ArsR family regulator